MTNTLPNRRLLPNRVLPPYSYVPGKFPHPERDPDGHSFEVQSRPASRPTETDWPTCDAYVWGIDLFNCGYYWEAHESWEQAWHACGRKGDTANLLKGLIKLAAAGVKAREGRVAGVQRHAGRAKQLFEQIVSQRGATAPFLGLSLMELIASAGRLCEQAPAAINTCDERVVRVMPFSLQVQGSP